MQNYNSFSRFHLDSIIKELIDGNYNLTMLNYLKNKYRECLELLRYNLNLNQHHKDSANFLNFLKNQKVN